MASSKHTGPVGYTGFVHPAATIRTKSFSIGGASLIDPFVSLEGDSAQIGVACNLQDNDRLVDFAAAGRQTPGDLARSGGGVRIELVRRARRGPETDSRPMHPFAFGND